MGGRWSGRGQIVAGSSGDRHGCVLEWCNVSHVGLCVPHDGLRFSTGEVLATHGSLTSRGTSNVVSISYSRIVRGARCLLSPVCCERYSAIHAQARLGRTRRRHLPRSHPRELEDGKESLGKEISARVLPGAGVPNTCRCAPGCRSLKMLSPSRVAQVGAAAGIENVKTLKVLELEETKRVLLLARSAWHVKVADLSSLAYPLLLTTSLSVRVPSISIQSKKLSAP